MKRKRIDKGRVARCPYCGRFINYFFLYDSKHYDYGHCSHCGGVYAVKWSSVLVLLGFCGLAVIMGSVLVHLIEQKEFPPLLDLLKMAGALVALYLLIPLFIVPTKLSVGGRLGGFPNRAAMPKCLQEELAALYGDGERDAELEEEAREMFVGYDDSVSVKPAEETEWMPEIEPEAEPEPEAEAAVPEEPAPEAETPEPEPEPAEPSKVPVVKVRSPENAQHLSPRERFQLMQNRRARH